MVTIFDVDANELIEVAKERLKKFEELRPPEWAKFVKTAPYKERPPQQDDWWYIRAAAILRYLYKIGRPIGVSRLRKKYGGSVKHRHEPPYHKRASGKIIRLILQQLERIGFVKKVETPRPGRVITPEGMRFLDKIAKEIYGSGKVEVKEIGKGF